MEPTYFYKITTGGYGPFKPGRGYNPGTSPIATPKSGNFGSHYCVIYQGGVYDISHGAWGEGMSNYMNRFSTPLVGYPIEMNPVTYRPVFGE